MAQRVKAFVSKPINPSSILRTHRKMERTYYWTLSSDLHTHNKKHPHNNTQSHTFNNNKTSKQKKVKGEREVSLTTISFILLIWMVFFHVSLKMQSSVDCTSRLDKAPSFLSKCPFWCACPTPVATLPRPCVFPRLGLTWETRLF